MRVTDQGRLQVFIRLSTSMTDSSPRSTLIQRAIKAGIAVAATGALVGGAMLWYWGSNYFGLKRLPGYIVPAPVHVNDAHLDSQPLDIHYRVLNLDKCVLKPL